MSDVPKQRGHLLDREEGATQELHRQGERHRSRRGDVGVVAQSGQGNPHGGEGQDADGQHCQTPEDAAGDLSLEEEDVGGDHEDGLSQGDRRCRQHFGAYQRPHPEGRTAQPLQDASVALPGQRRAQILKGGAGHHHADPASY